MTTQRFSTGKQFTWLAATYVVKRLLPGSRVSIENVHTGEVRVVVFAELAHALFAGELCFSASRTSDALTPANGQPDLSDYPSALRQLAEYRFEIIRPLLLLSPDDRTRAAVAARVTEIKQAQMSGQKAPKTAVSATSVYRWIRAYTDSGLDIRSLVGNSPRQGGGGKPRLEEESEAIVRAVIEDRYYVSERVTLDDIYLEVLLRIEEENRFRPGNESLPAPSRATTWRRIGALDEKEKLAAKCGRRAAERRFTQYGSTTYPTLPLQRVEIDHTRLDIIVVDERDNLPLGRPTFTYCLDTATRYPLGFYIGFEPPSYLTVMQCLHQAILSKGDVGQQYGTQHSWIACGIPFALIVDNGREFIGADLRDACHCLGIELLQMPVRMPHFKAAVERMFGTLNTGLLHTLPGTTFSTPGERGEYNSKDEACITLADLTKVFHIFLLDVYAESFHHGLGSVPARRWEEATQEGFFPRLPASAHDLKILLCRVARRQVLPSGIQFLNLRYNSPSLAPLRTHLKDEKAKVKYDPANLGCIYVYNPHEQAYIEVECLDKEYAQGLSLWKHCIILRTARQEEGQVDVLALARAKRKIQEVIQASKSSKKVKSRSRAARWESGSRPAEGTNETNVPDAVQPQPVLPESSPTSCPRFLDLSLSLEDLEKEGWSAGYDLPITDR